MGGGVWVIKVRPEASCCLMRMESFAFSVPAAAMAAVRKLLKAMPFGLERFPEATARCVERCPPLLPVPVVEGIVPGDYRQ